MRKLTKKEMAEMKAKSDIFFAEVESRPGYDEVEVEIRRLNDIGNILDTIAKRSGKTQQQIAQAMKVSQPYVSNLRKTGEISVKNLMAYAEACGAKLKIAATF
jgi:predicted XRE-type DNA-binding protein